MTAIDLCYGIDGILLKGGERDTHAFLALSWFVFSSGIIIVAFIKFHYSARLLL